LAGYALLKATNLGGAVSKGLRTGTIARRGSGAAEVSPAGGLAQRAASTGGRESGPPCGWNWGLGGAEFFCVDGPAPGVIFIKDVVESDLRRFA
jgi:hypothetical protein